MMNIFESNGNLHHLLFYGEFFFCGWIFIVHYFDMLIMFYILVAFIWQIS